MITYIDSNTKDVIYSTSSVNKFVPRVGDYIIIRNSVYSVAAVYYDVIYSSINVHATKLSE